MAGLDAEDQPRLLVIWGKYDSSFEPTEPEAIARTFRTPRFTSSTPATSHSTRRPTRLLS